MKASTIQWHLARDNQAKLARFCENNKVKSSTELDTYSDEDGKYFQIEYTFDNGGFITAELKQGDTRSYSVADHFQVVAYALEWQV